MYKIRSITIKTSFLLHKNLPGLILGGYIILYRYTPRRYGGYIGMKNVTQSGRRDVKTKKSRLKYVNKYDLYYTAQQTRSSAIAVIADRTARSSTIG